MKCFIFLLACLAAANASSVVYSTPYHYSYYCSHHFNVWPSCSSYRYTVYFPSTWYSYNYYCSYLKTYPSNSQYCVDHHHCWSERSVSSLVSETRNTLAARRRYMCSQMYARRDSFFRAIDYEHARFAYYYKYYLSRWYVYTYRHRCGYTGYYVVRDSRISEYCNKLASIRSNLWNSYNSAISAKINALTTFHDKLAKNVETCLNTRLSKIAEFKRALSSRISSYYSRFYSMHCSMALKNRDHYKETLKNLFYRYSNDWWVNFKASIAVSYYYGRQKSQVYYIASSYRSHMYSYQRKLIPWFVCNYKCVLSSGCTSYSSKSYYSYCKTLGSWWCYKSSYHYDRYCLAPFKIKFTPCSYKTLKTCDVNAAVGSIDGLLSQLRGQRDQVIRDNSSKFSSWRATWVNNFYRYKSAFWSIVILRHNVLCWYQRYQYISVCGYLTSVQTAYLSQMKNDLISRANSACYSYYKNLLNQLAAADRAHAETQQKFKDAFNTLISKLQANFDACKNTRNAKIAEYKKKLEDSRNKQRSALLSKFYEVKNAHWSKFNTMLRHYHGSCYYKYYWISAMRSCYASHLVGHCNEIMAQFDSFWRSMIPKLVMHYACCYKCTVTAKFTPKYSCGYWYSWKYCLPTYSTYTYRYSCYTRVYSLYCRYH